MISRGKRKYLVNLCQPEGFFYRGDKLCFKMGGMIIVGMKPIEADVINRPITYDINFDVLKEDGLLEPFNPSKCSQWGQWTDVTKPMQQFSRHHMATLHPNNLKFLEAK